MLAADGPRGPSKIVNIGIRDAEPGILLRQIILILGQELNVPPFLLRIHSPTFPARPVAAMSNTDAEKQLLLDQLHLQFKNAISYNLYTGLAYGAQHHHLPPFPSHFPVDLQGCFSSCTSFQSGYSCEFPPPRSGFP